MNKNIKLTIEFNGTNYFGWQRQVDKITIQGQIESAIYKLTGQFPKLIGCGRTDRGVHGKKYICNFKSDTNIPIDKIKYGLNHYLKNDIYVIKSEEAEESFHSRYSAKLKTYSYKILNREYPSPILRDFVCHYVNPLNLDLMRDGSKFIVGTHDFSAFRSSGSEVKNTIKTIKSLTINKNEDIISITITGDGFLYNMVRIICGTLIDVSEGKIKPSYINEIIESKDRRKAGMCLPPQGLYLESVEY